MTVSESINQAIDYTRQYEKWHSDTPEHIQQMKDFYKKMLHKFLPSKLESRILDVGCGMGFTLMSLQEIGYVHLEGIDIDSGQVQSCLNKKLNVTHVQDSTTFLRSMSNSYDLIVAIDVIEHIPHDKQFEFVRAINLALKSGGKLICTVPNANSALASRWRYIDWTHHVSFTEHSLDFLLFNAGFSSIEIHETEFFYPPYVPKILSRNILRKWFWNLILSEDFRKTLLHWQIFKVVRLWQRAQMIAELGWEQGAVVPLSLNILAIGVKHS
jgi:cyclopropane fatty-acyl-phospholipid synthase-like methyltransferase